MHSAYASADNVNGSPLGERMHALAAQLFPICRSITGNGVRETLRILQEHIPVEMLEVPSGTPVFDWMYRTNGTYATHGSRTCRASA